jgi:hypothetical protein
MKSTVRSLARIAVFVAGVALPTVASRRASAASIGVRLSVNRAPDAGDCPDAGRLAAGIARAGHRSLPSIAPNAEARLRFEVDMARSATGYAATVRILGARIGVRQIEHTGGTCAPLADALAVALVVVIDDVEQADATVTEATTPSPSTQPAQSAEAPAPPPPPPPPPAPPDKIERRDNPTPDLVLVPSRTADNSAFFELGGSGLFYTFNFEHIFGDSNVSLRIGFGYIHLDADLAGNTFNEEDISVPMVASYYVGKSSHKLQLGAGMLLLYRQGDQGSSDGTTTSLLATAIIGYRYIPENGGINFGVAFTPCFGQGIALPWGGVDFGVGF